MSNSNKKDINNVYLYEDFIEMLTWVSHPIKNANWETLNLVNTEKGINFLSYEPFLDYDDIKALKETELKISYYEVIKELQSLMKYKKYEEFNQITTNDIKEAINILKTDFIHENYEMNIRDYLNINLEDAAQYYLDEKVEWLQMYGEEKLGASESEIESLINELNKHTATSWLQEVSKNQKIDLEHIAIDFDEFDKYLFKTDVDSYILDATPLEVSNDLASLEHSLDLLKEILIPYGDDETDLDLDEYLDIHKKLIEEILEEPDNFNNGFVRMLSQQGLDLETLSDFEKLQSFKEANKNFVNDLETTINEWSEYLSTTIYMVTMTKEEMLYLETMRELSTIALDGEISYLHKQNGIKPEIEINIGDTKYNVQWVDMIPKEFMSQGIKLERVTGGIYSPNVGANGYLSLSNIDVSIPFTSIYCNSLIGNTSGHFGYNYKDVTDYNPRILTPVDILETGSSIVEINAAYRDSGYNNKQNPETFNHKFLEFTTTIDELDNKNKQTLMTNINHHNKQLIP